MGPTFHNAILLGAVWPLASSYLAWGAVPVGSAIDIWGLTPSISAASWINAINSSRESAPA